MPQPHLPAKTSSMPADIRQRGSKHFLAVIVLAAAASLAACAGTVSEHRATPILASAGSIRLTSERPGLLVDDGFHHPEVLSHLEERYEINGSAPQPDRFASVDSTGLNVGVREHQPGVFEGSFAMTRDTYPPTSVFHIHMARQDVDVPQKDCSGEAIFAVQTGTTKKTGVLNYVLVASSTNAGLTHWLVGYAEGKVANAKTTVLWETPYVETDRADKYQDISLRTDGRTSLEVWFGTRLVYSSQRLDLHIDPPFQPYLEVQGLQIGYVSTFTDFSVVADSALTIRGLHPHEAVSFVPNGQPAVDVVASATGEARIPLPLPAVRGTATMTLGRASGLRLGPFPYAGGDEGRLNESG